MRCSVYSIRDIRVIRGFFVVEPDFVATVSPFSLFPFILIIVSILSKNITL